MRAGQTTAERLPVFSIGEMVKTIAAKPKQSLTMLSAYELFVALLALIFFLVTVLRGIGGSGFGDLLSHIALVGIGALGMMVVTKAAGVDLSFGAVAAASAACVTVFSLLRIPYAYLLGVALSVVGGLIFGVLNGWIVARGRLPSAVTTLVSGALLIAVLFTYGYADLVPPTSHILRLVGTEQFIGISLPFLMLVIFMVITYYLTDFTSWGRLMVSARGKPDENLTEREQTQLLIGSYAFSGFCGALVGIGLSCQGFSPKFILESGWHLLPLTALLVGGALFSHAQARLRHVIIGSLAVGCWTLKAHVFHSSHPVLFLTALLLLLSALAEGWKRATWQEVKEFLPLRLPHHFTRHFIGGMSCLAVLGLGIAFTEINSGRIPLNSAMVVRVSGESFVKPAGVNEWKKVEHGQILGSGDELKTSSDGAVVLQTSNRGVVKVSAGSQMRVEQIRAIEETAPVTRFRLMVGRVWIKVEMLLLTDERFEVQTASAVAAVRGTFFSVASSMNKTYVSVDEGATEVTAKDKTVVVQAGQEAWVLANQPPSAPRPMSPEERLAWARERPILEQPHRQELWEAVQHTSWLSDSFDAAQVNARMWYLRAADPQVSIRQSRGHLVVGGTRSLLGASPTSQGMLTLTFPKAEVAGILDASVKFMLPQGDGEVVFQLADERGSAEGVGVVFQPRRGYRLKVGSKPTPVNLTAPARNDERQEFHQIWLHYDAGAGLLTGYLDDTLIGTHEVNLARQLHFELLYECLREGEAFQCRFDDFSSNVALPHPIPMETSVAVVTNPFVQQPPSLVLTVIPLVTPERVKSVEVTYPEPEQPASPFYAGRFQRERLPFEPEVKAWTQEVENVGEPVSGSYYFRYKTIDKQPPVMEHRYEREQKLSPVPNLRDGREGQKIVVAWDALRDANYYWVHVLKMKDGEKEVIFTSTPLTQTGCSLLNPGLVADDRYFIAVFAHRAGIGRITLTDPSFVPHWAQSCLPILMQLAPTEAASISLSGMQGTDYFSVQCGQERSW